MGIYLDNDITASSIIVNNMYSKIKTNTSQFLNIETDEFDSLLKQSSKAEDKKKDEIYKSQATDKKEEIRNKELKDLTRGNNIERMMFDLSQNVNQLYRSPLVNGLATQAIKAFV